MPLPGNGYRIRQFWQQNLLESLCQPILFRCRSKSIIVTSRVNYFMFWAWLWHFPVFIVHLEMTSLPLWCECVTLGCGYAWLNQEGVNMGGEVDSLAVNLIDGPTVGLYFSFDTNWVSKGIDRGLQSAITILWCVNMDLWLCIMIIMTVNMAYTQNTYGGFTYR